KGLPAPQFVFANYEDYGYFLTLLDSTSVRALETGALGSVGDPFLRTMLWGALWDQVRDAKYDPSRFARLALRELPRETDEQIFPNILGRMSRSITTYAGPASHDSLVREAEIALWSGANDTKRAYGIRRAYIDAFMNIAGTPDAITKLTSLLTA